MHARVKLQQSQISSDKAQKNSKSAKFKTRRGF